MNDIEYFLGADFPRLHLEGANLKKTNFEGANLEGACLRGANLEEANFRDAYLAGTDLRNTNIRGTDFGYANLQRAILSDNVIFLVGPWGWVVIQSDWIQIGGWLLYSVEDWKNFTDQEIKEMYTIFSFEWWQENKARLIYLAESLKK